MAAGLPGGGRAGPAAGPRPDRARRPLALPPGRRGLPRPAAGDGAGGAGGARRAGRAAAARPRRPRGAVGRRRGGRGHRAAGAAVAARGPAGPRSAPPPPDPGQRRAGAPDDPGRAAGSAAGGRRGSAKAAARACRTSSTAGTAGTPPGRDGRLEHRRLRPAPPALRRFRQTVMPRGAGRRAVPGGARPRGAGAASERIPPRARSRRERWTRVGTGIRGERPPSRRGAAAFMLMLPQRLRSER